MTDGWELRAPSPGRTASLRGCHSSCALASTSMPELLQCNGCKAFGTNGRCLPSRSFLCKRNELHIRTGFVPGLRTPPLLPYPTQLSASFPTAVHFRHFSCATAH